MDIDAFVVAHRDQWDRMDRLVSRRRLTGAEIDELVTLYRASASHLSRVRSSAPDPQLVAELSTRVARGRARITGTRELRVNDLRRFWVSSVPAAMYRLRWWAVTVGLIWAALVLVVSVWTLYNPVAYEALGSARDLQEYAQSDFEGYYTQFASSEFAALVWTNNARLAAVNVAGGLTGVIPAGVLFVNALTLGQAGAVMAHEGALELFLRLIIPHGLLELSCLIISGAAGIRLFWVMLVPGPHSRSVALAREGRATMTVAAGLVVALFISGLIEAFVTPAELPWGIKLVTGIMALVGLCVYVLVLGRRAVAEGETGDLDECEAGVVAAEAG